MTGAVPLKTASLTTPSIGIGIYVEGSCWPSWVHLTTSCYFNVVWIWSPFKASITPFLLKGFNHFSFLGTAKYESFAHVEVLLCSGRAPRATHPCWISNLVLVLSHSLPSDVFVIKSKQWFVSSLTYKHATLGGVTDLTGTIFLFTRDQLSINPRWQRGPTRSLKSILSSKIPGKQCSAPLNLPQGQPTVSYMRDGTVHPGGLIPFKSLKTTKTISAFVFNETKFCCRTLSVDERLAALDHNPEWFSEFFTHQDKETISDMITQPCKVLVTFGKLLFGSGGVVRSLLLHHKHKSNPNVSLTKVSNKERSGSSSDVYKKDDLGSDIISNKKDTHAAKAKVVPNKKGPGSELDNKAKLGTNVRSMESTTKPGLAENKKVRFNLSPNMDKTKANSEHYVTTGFFKNFKRKLLRPVTPLLKTNNQIPSKPSFDLPQENIFNRVHILQKYFSPRVFNESSIASIKIIATKYTLPNSNHKDNNMISTDRISKAAKADNAAVPTDLWDLRILRIFNTEDKSDNPRPDWFSLGILRSLDILRSQFTVVACRLLFLSFMSWYKTKFGNPKLPNVIYWCKRDSCYKWLHQGKIKYEKSHRTMRGLHWRSWNGGLDAVRRFTQSTWWTWKVGSRIHFWRWPKSYVSIVRDGHPLWLERKLKPYRVPQRDQKDQDVKKQVVSKLNKVRTLGYIEKGKVDSLTSFFAVPKTDTDIRMVYDATVSGLNDVVWAPWFALPTVRTHLRAVGPHTFMGDNDLGDHFLNFILADKFRRLAGVDLQHYFPDELNPGKTLWERWARALMGFRPSPYLAIQGARVAQEFAMGDPLSSNNIFQWSKVRLNLPGQINYNPSLPWVSKIRQDGSLAADIFQYVDDIRPTGNTEDECWEAGHVYGSRVNYLGLQDAARKRRPPSQTPGPWAGSMIETDGDRVKVESVSCLGCMGRTFYSG